MGEVISIEVPDAARAAYLMSELVGRFRASLTDEADGRWEIRVDVQSEPMPALSDLLGVVQHWIDRADTWSATIRLRGREYEMRNGPTPIARGREISSVG
jgi:hypothetical protein